MKKLALALAAAAAATATALPAPAAQAQGLTCRGFAATMVGTEGANRLTGTAARDVIVALGGNDVISGADGNDVICAGPGDDRVAGGNGTDTVDAGLGNDACLTAETRISCEPGSATTFMPTRHGFPFVNHFTAIPTFVTPLGTIGLDYGLCGGMAFAALDNWRFDDVAPGTTTTPQSGQVFDYLWTRLVDSLTLDLSWNLFRYADLQNRTNAQLVTSNAVEAQAIVAQLASRPTPVGVVIPAAGQPIWGNHQVLAIGHFTRNGSTVLKVYDPNEPDVISYLDVNARTLGRADDTTPSAIRGLFHERYNQRSAPWNS